MPKIEVRPVNKEEIDAVKLCIAKSFKPELENPSIPNFIQIKLESKEFFWGVFENNIAVSGVMFVPFQLIIEKTSLQVVGLTGLGTHPKYRHKGYATKLLQGIHEFLIKQGFDGIVLHSAADILYQKNGYEFAFCQWIAEKSAKDFISKKRNGEKENSQCIVDFIMINEINDSLLEELFHIYEFSPQNLTIPVRLIRSYAYFSKQMIRLLNEGYYLAVLRRNDQYLGYILAKFNHKVLEIYELYSINGNEFDYYFLLKELIEQFEKPQFQLKLKMDKNELYLTEFLRKNKFRIYKEFLVGNMATIFDPYMILQKMTPTLSFRYSTLEKEEKNEEKNIEGIILNIRNFSEDKILLKFYLSIVIVQKLNDFDCDHDYKKILITKSEFIALIFGYISFKELDYEIDKETERILNCLFPNLEPVWDNFAQY